MIRLDPQSVLLQLLLSGPNYGLDLMVQVKERTDGKLSLSQGATYSNLMCMEADGLLKSYMGDEKIPDRGGRRRRYFKLTEKGAKQACADRKVIEKLIGGKADRKAMTLGDSEKAAIKTLWLAQTRFGNGAQSNNQITDQLFAWLIENGWMAKERVVWEGEEGDYFFVTLAGLKAAGLRVEELSKELS